MNLLQRHVDWMTREDKLQHMLNLSHHKVKTNSSKNPVVNRLKKKTQAIAQEQRERAKDKRSAGANKALPLTSVRTAGSVSEVTLSGKPERAPAQILDSASSRTGNGALRETFEGASSETTEGTSQTSYAVTPQIVQVPSPFSAEHGIETLQVDNAETPLCKYGDTETLTFEGNNETETGSKCEEENDNEYWQKQRKLFSKESMEEYTKSVQQLVS